MGYRERQEEKAERAREHADNATRRADGAYEKARQIGDMIPLGQPILVGHHSEAHARRDVERINAGMRRFVDETDKAAYWRRRAEAIESDTSISRLDPDAVPLLEAKIALLEEAHASMKRVSVAIRTGKLTGLSESETRSAQAIPAGPPDFRGKHTMPSYLLTNSSANIRRYRQRLEQARRDAEKRISPDDRRELAIDAYYRDRYPSLRVGVLARVGDWARANGDKGEWREFKRLMLNVLTDDEIDALTTSD